MQDSSLPPFRKAPSGSSSHHAHDARSTHGHEGGSAGVADAPASGARACLLVPAYQAARSIEDVLDELKVQLPEVCRDPRALIVIDDGSTDATGALAARAGAHVVAHGRNRGKGAALATGLATARAMGFDVAVTVDADGQHPGASARTVLHASADPKALVLGIRDLVRDGAPRANQFSNGLSNFFLSRFTGVPLADTQCGLRRYPVATSLALGARAEGYAFEAEIILRALAKGVPLVEVSVPVYYPPEDQRVSHFDRVRDPARIVATVVRTLHELHRG
ncbi:MAG TPA: glycosyltransferase family 2 protein [Polyangiaceae bacterium]|jgi:glycosyltransferase involved in cell wall biosynthesis